MAAGALATVPFDPRFTLLPPPSAQIWLVLLAIGSQVIGWLLIGTALPRLPAIETSVLLLGQPVFAVIWGVLIFRERLSPAPVARLGHRPRRRRVPLASLEDVRSTSDF